MEQHSGNLSELGSRDIPIRPRLPGFDQEFRAFCSVLAKLLRATQSSGRQLALEQTREDIQSSGNVAPSKREVAFKFACSVIVDVAAQGWGISVTRNGIQLSSPRVAGIAPDELKRRVREGHVLERDAQLREPSVRGFIKTMEQRRLGPAGWVSVFSLMRDGRELARQLKVAARESDQAKQLKVINACVIPYLQAVDAAATCDFTGLKLVDIWRYFRHTWVSSYKSVPGRGMMVLIRDAAAPNHPVIGIAALGSSMAQQTLRDRWIGWDSEIFEKNLVAKPTVRLARWVTESVDRLIESIYVADLIKDGIVERREIKQPTELAVKRLLREHSRARAEHRRFSDHADHKNNGASVNWRLRALLPLFRSKRSKTLATLLGIRANLNQAGFDGATRESLAATVVCKEGRHAIRQLVRLVKAEHVGVDMMDIIVCGAVAPYNALLGGKLICMLLTSPEVVLFYRQRYGNQASVIASSTKGKAVKRPPNLVMLATTSLYGVGSSQYNRVRVPVAELGGEPGAWLKYENLGVSKGYGSYHFSRASIDYLETLLGRAGGGRKVNSIFGEGVNPLMRKLRDGLIEVGLPADALLRHGNARVVYGVALAKNFREVLLGLAATPKYFLPLSRAKEQTKKLADYWRRRWLSKRIAVPGILESVSTHSLVYPIRHGARVSLPTINEDVLFSDEDR
jgi:Domain of unknown function (DUF4338)